MSFGLLYVATGERCCNEAILNAVRSLSFQSDLSISIKTDQTKLALESGVFTEVLDFNQPSFSYRDKIVGLLDLPYENTLFLDSDACLIDTSRILYSIIDCVDLAAACAPVRHPPGWSDSTVPLLFPELNTGVLLMRRVPQVRNFVQSWLHLYDQLVVTHAQLWDQASFRSVLWSGMRTCDLKFIHLPLEANLRTTKPWIVGRGLPALVIHGRYPTDEFTPFVNYLNADIDRFRTWTEWLNMYPKSEIRPRFDRTFG